MSAAGTAGGKLPATLRALFDSLLRRQPEPDGAPSAATGIPDATPAGEDGPAQRLLAGPGGPAPLQARPAAGALVQQAGFFEAPGPRPGSRALFLKDFTARFHDVLRRGGITARDPLHPVLTMLGEMLVHFTHLQADHTGVSERASDIVAARLREEGARVQAGIAGEGRDITRAVSQGAGRIEAAAAEVKRAREDVQRGFREDTETLLRDAVTELASIRNARNTLVMAAVAAGAFLAVGAVGVWYGRSQEREDAALAMQAIKDPLLAAALRDGKATAEHWLHVMQWNHFDTAEKTCGTQRDGIGYRAVCSYAFWDSQPLDPPPAPPLPRAR